MNSRFQVRDLVLIPLFTALLAVVSTFSIPLGPVPITLQTLVVMLTGSVLGPKRGFLSMIVYIALAAVGAPVLAGGKSGLAALLGPTGGYIFSWPIAAFIIGVIVYSFSKKSGLKLWHIIIAHLIGGTILIHLCGFTWFVVTTGAPLVKETFMSVLVIFLPGDVIKVVFGAIVVLALHKAIPNLIPKKATANKSA
ncbi:biotin transporter BioY [Hazenella coriacea]|uniref:Biotin transporter n=1 Tax=Hazenella coriacea TaxID=1179467 RepID=A0A4R3LA28_9BACL|nr:biotin transporter BioY [Hazenella coriacea]TCS95094.1 biotin transport system substrate-specific component [Hazenella coriacea]